MLMVVWALAMIGLCCAESMGQLLLSMTAAGAAIAMQLTRRN